MEIIIELVKAIHIIVSILLIITVLLQPGKGGDIGSVFGGGASESIFGSSGAVPFLTKATRVLAVLFIATSLSLGYFSAQGISSSVVNDVMPVTEPFESPLASPEGESPAPEASPSNPEQKTEGGASSESSTGSESGATEGTPQPEGGSAQ